MVCALTVNAQKTDAMLYGHVKSVSTGQHLPYATITVKGTKLKTATDATGHYRLVNLPVGKQTIVASLVGYKNQEVTVTMESDKESIADFALEDDVLELNQVVVTGTHSQNYVKNVPIRTEVVTSKALENKNATNLYEALTGVPGVRVEQQCQFCNFSEVRMQGLGAEHTQVLIDGEPVYSGLAGVYGLQQMGVNDVDRIEIVKGAGSALYGSSAVAGAINLVTKEPAYEPRLSADVQMGNWGFKNFNVAGSMRHNDVGLNVFAQRTEADAVDATQDGETRSEVKKKDGVSDRVESTMNSLGFGLYIYNPLAHGDKLVLRGKAMSEERAGGTMTGDLFRNPFSEGTENIKTNRLTADLQYTLPIGSKSELNAALAYVNHHRNATNDTYLTSYMGAHDGASPDVQDMRPYLARENTFTPSLTFSTILGNHNLLAGAQGYFTRLKETGLYCVDDKESPYYRTSYTSTARKHADEVGFFLQDEWNITSELAVVPGVRVDYHSSGEEYAADKKVADGSFPETKFEKTTFNPRLAIKYAPMQSLVLRANVGTGFRAPYGFSEDLHLCSGSPRVWKSSGLKGERSMSFNLSADYYGSNYQLSVNVFRTNLKNKIEFSPADDNVKKLGYTYQWENVDDAYVQGIELGGRVKPFRDFSASLNWTINQGKYDHVRDDWKDTQYANDSRNVSRFPAMTGDLNLEYTPNTWTFTVTGSLQGRMYIDYHKDDEEATKIKKTNPFTLWNVRVAKRLGHHFTVYAGGKNIFSYLQDEKHGDDAAFMYAPVFGATWYAGVKVNM